MDKEPVFVPHTAGHLLNATHVAPWLAENLRAATSRERPPGQPVFRSAADAWAWVDWARREGGLARLPFAVARVDGALTVVDGKPVLLPVTEDALRDPAAQVPRALRPVSELSARLAEASVRATGEAVRRWKRTGRAELVRPDRVRMAATTAWEAIYPVAYQHAYETLARRAAQRFRGIPDVVSDSERTRDHITPAVRRLVDVALAAAPGQVPVPELPAQVMRTAKAAVRDTHGVQRVAESVTRAVRADAVVAGGLQGALAAGADIVREWRRCVDQLDVTTRTRQGALGDVVNASLAALNREFVAPWLAQHGPPAGPALGLVQANFAAPAGTAVPRPPTPGSGPPPPTTRPLRYRSRP